VVESGVRKRESIGSLERNYSSSAPELSKRKIIISVVLTAIIVWLIGLYFQSASKCYDQTCFDEKLKTCQRTTFVGISDGVVYGYSIEGRSGDVCVVDVRLLQGQLNEKNSQVLEGKSMSCELPFGVVIKPESDIKNCHGPLKEGLQEVIIENLHAYIVGNLDKINDEINK